VKKLRQWIYETFGILVSRNTICRALKRSRLSWKKIKKLLSKADPD
jgi:transposase